MTSVSISELKQLWSTLLGRTPSDQQFALWSAKHSPEIIRQGIVKAAQKNLQLGGTMSDDHRIRFASSVMNARSARKTEHQRNRETLSQEFEAKAGGQ